MSSSYVSCPTCKGKGIIPIEEARDMEDDRDKLITEARERGSKGQAPPQAPSTYKKVRVIRRQEEQS